MQTNIYWCPWMVWVLIAIATGLLEVVLPSFTFSFLSLSAGVAAVISIWFSQTVQIITFSGLALVFVALLRPWLRKRFHVADQIPSRTQRFHRQKGEVTEAIDPIKAFGRVTVAGEYWAARAERAIAVGRVVEVIGSDGIILIVKEI